MKKSLWLLGAVFTVLEASSHLEGLGGRNGAAVAVGAFASAPQAAQAPASAPAASSEEAAMLRRYCVTCHNGTLKTAHLALDSLDVSDPAAHPEIWEKVIQKLRAGVMPPAGRPRPDPATIARFASRLEATLDRRAELRPDPGHQEPFHRLNRVEYRNAIRDLLHLEIDAASLLPADDVSYGFDNIAGTLKLSPALVERYVSAAQRIARLAVGAAPQSPGAEVFRLPGDLSQYDRMEGLPLGTRGGTVIPYNFPQDAAYEIRVELLKNRDGSFYLTERQDLEVSLDGERVELFTLTPAERRRGAPQDADADEQVPPSGVFRVRLPVKAGPHNLAVAFIRKTAAVEERPRQRFLRVYNASYVEYMVSVGSVTISGPFDAVGPGDTPSRRRLFTCRPTEAARQVPCAREILSTLARRAYRRQPAANELDDLMHAFEEGRAGKDFEDGVERAIQRVLVSPFFLFRIEGAQTTNVRRSPADSTPVSPQRISDVDLASRLSFFLWSSVPDDALLEAALSRRLHEPTVLEAQVRRMIADPRSEALSTNFASQWLHLRNLPASIPFERMFPDFDEGLRRALNRETELFVDHVIREDRPLPELLTADYTFLNERAARHYGLEGVYGPDFRRVTIGDERRRGLLGHGSVLTVTSQANRTSPVVRGKWIMENILGTPPPPPPPNVPPLPDGDGAKPMTMRERMVQHRSNPVCSSCHSMMDPLGLALENFDAVGQWRDRDAGGAVDASGALPDGAAFDGVIGLRQALVKRSELFAATFTQKLLTYALGRGLDYYDAPTVRAIVRQAAAREYHMSSFILGIVQSTPFQMRRAQS